MRLDSSTSHLRNGLTVILHVNRNAPVVAVVVFVRAGSRNERPGKTGLAHLFEHLMFKGSRGVADGEHFRLLQEVGATVNGATSEDRTFYYEVVPRIALEQALFLESDRLGGLLEALTEEKLENQRSVVINERRQRYENQPYGVAPELISGVFFPGDHPYRWPVIGYPEDLRRAGLDDMQDFFRSCYTPGNICLSLAGDFDPDEALRLVDRYFSGIPEGTPPPRPSRAPVRVEQNRRIIHEDTVALPRLYLVWPAPPLFSPEEPAADLLATILGDGKNSRLTMSLITTRRIAQTVSVYIDPMELDGMSVIDVTGKPDMPLTNIEADIMGTLSDIAENGVKAEELAAARLSVRRSLVQGRLSNFGRAYGFALCQTAGGGADTFNDEFARYDAVTGADIRKAAERLRGPNVGLSVVPQGKLNLVSRWEN
jgi:zinc protease